MRRSRWSPAVLLLLAACSERSSSFTGIAAANGASGAPSVGAVAPDNAPQDTTLDVVVTGTNFDRGSRVDLALAGVFSDSVRTNRTTFVNSRKLIANITIAAHADTGRYDVVVTAGTGKKGIGTELFAIKANRLAIAFFGVDYSAESQSGKGVNSESQIHVPEGPYSLTIAYPQTDIAACEDGGTRLTQVLGTRVGSLGVEVDKTQFVGGVSGKGVVVNYTVTGDDGASYFLTTGGGQNTLDDSGVTLTRVTKSGGYLRVKRNGERVGALCNAVVDFEFTVSK